MKGLYAAAGRVHVGTSAEQVLKDVYGEDGLGDGIVSIGAKHVVRRIFLDDVLKGRVLDANGKEPTVLRVGDPKFAAAVERLGDAVREPSRIVYWEKPVTVAWTMFPSGHSPLLWAKGEVEGLQFVLGGKDGT